jgi:hypothetical protein
MLKDILRIESTPWDKGARLLDRVAYTMASVRVVFARAEERRKARGA